MNTNVLQLTGKDVEGLALLSSGVLECAEAANAKLKKMHDLICKILVDNVRRLELDEDIFHLCCFARSVACELMTNAARSKHFPVSCWQSRPWVKSPPFFSKIDGKSSPDSEIREGDAQGVAMANTLFTILLNDPYFASGAEKLLAYQQSEGLWTDDDEVLRY